MERRQKTQDSQHNIEGEKQSQRTDYPASGLTMKSSIQHGTGERTDKEITGNRIESPELHPHKYSQLTFTKEQINSMEKG